MEGEEGVRGRGGQIFVRTRRGMSVSVSLAVFFFLTLCMPQLEETEVRRWDIDINLKTKCFIMEEIVT